MDGKVDEQMEGGRCEAEQRNVENSSVQPSTFNLQPSFQTLLSRAPIVPRKVWKRVGNRAYLCATIGAEFDQWQRRLAAVSAADAYFAQRIGLDAVERLMDELEAEIRPTLAPGETLKPRRSPGYGEMPLALSREILDALDATKKIGVSLTDSLLLVPSKSVTAICEIV